MRTNNRLKVYFWCLLIIPLLISGLSYADDFQYYVSKYQATFELNETTSDVKVTLDLTYEIGNQSKSDGFKFVGKNRVTGVSCRDGSGKPLQTEILSLKETKIVWHFPEIKNGKQRVITSFTLKDFLKKKNGYYFLEAGWAGVFRIPVQKAVFEVIFPKQINPKVINSEPGLWQKSFRNGRYNLITTQTPLTKREMLIEFESGAEW